MKKVLLIILALEVFFSFSCALKQEEKISYVRDSNKDGKIDECKYSIGSGVVVYLIDTNHDGFFDKKFSLNREKLKYNIEFNAGENKRVLDVINNDRLIYY